MLEIINLHVSVGNKPLLKGINLCVNAGEIHAIMGPNGSGKSTLGHVIAGREGYEITQGEIRFKGKNIAELLPEERAREGLFLAFQYPVAIPGVSNINFLKTAVNNARKYRGLTELDTLDFLNIVKAKMASLDMKDELLTRAVNDGFSGGEKKRNEILQMTLLEPSLAILDETDSGLDIDALKIVAEGVNVLRNESRAFIVITHYQRLLDYITPDYVHVLAHGQIVKSGDRKLALELEELGYGWIEEKHDNSSN